MKAGDKIEFAADRMNGAITVTKIGKGHWSSTSSRECDRWRRMPARSPRRWSLLAVAMKMAFSRDRELQAILEPFACLPECLVQIDCRRLW